MRHFLIGFVLIPLAVVGADVLLRVSQKLRATEDLLRLVLLLCVFPTLAAGLMATAVHRHRPRRMFDLARRSPGRPFVAGLLAGLLAVGFAALPIALVQSTEYDAVILSASAAIASLVVVAPFARRRIAGRCVACDYDLRGSMGAGRCPECGAALCGGPCASS